MPEDIYVIKDSVTEDLELTQTTRIEGPISKDVEIFSDDPNVHLSIPNLPSGVHVDIAGDFSSIKAINASIEARNVDIHELVNTKDTFKDDEGTTHTVRGFSHIDAEETIVIDRIRGNKDSLNKNNPAVRMTADTIIIEGKEIEGYFFPEELETADSRSFSPNAASNEIDEEQWKKIQARLAKIQEGPKISKVQVADLPSNVPSGAEKIYIPLPDDSSELSSETSSEPKGKFTKDLADERDNRTSGPRVSPKNVSDYINENSTPPRTKKGDTNKGR